MLPSLCYGKANFRQTETNLFSKLRKHPRGVCVAGGCFSQAPTPPQGSCGLCWAGWEEGEAAQAFAVLAASGALSVLPVPCHCPLHPGPFSCSFIPFLLSPEPRASGIEEESDLGQELIDSKDPLL